jgi:glycosyltransferase involved in cell wall biosynthesis
VGFFGVIDERMNLELVGELAQRCPDIQFVLIGPVVKIDPSALPQASNLHWLGARPYQELPQYLAGWNAGFMPFALNESTRFISPTKTPEFLAAGVPVCSTPIVDVVRPYGESGLVEVAANAQEFEQRLRHLLDLDRETWLARVDDFLGQCSWDQTWADMHDVMQKAREAPPLHAISQGVMSESAYV